MSPPLALDDADFGIDLDAPQGFRSTNDKHQFMLWFAILAGAVFLLQIVLPQVLMMFLAPAASPFSGGMNIQVPHVDRAFRWRDELWVPFEKVQPGRPSQHVLKVLTDKGDWAKDRDVTVTIDAKHCIPDGERLWLVNDGAVAFLENGQATTLYPRRRLSQPSNPFLYDDELCVLDRQPNGQYRWLRYSEGEWIDRGSLSVPRVTTASATAPSAPSVTPSGVPTTAPLPPVAWQSETLRVVEHEGETRLFFAGSNQLWTTSLIAPPDTVPEEIVATDDEGPASAARPDNVDPRLLNLDWTGLGQLRTNDWHVVPLEGRLAVVWRATVPFNVEISASWLDELDQQPFAKTNALVMDHVGVVPGESAAAVMLDTFPPGGCRQIPLTAAGFGSPMGGGQDLFNMFGMFGDSYFSAAIVANSIPLLLMLGLVIAGHYLMAKHRDLRYCFGHDTVRLGSLGRRTVARIVDSLIYSVPMWSVMVWLYLTFDLQQIVDGFAANWRQMLTTILLVVLGFMAYGLFVVIVMGTLEGWYGWTPGKLLCGLRVVRTNFRKCGMLRGVLRQILLIIDGFFQYLVGIVMIGVMPKCQRLGDLVADTIVVEADSLPPG